MTILLRILAVAVALLIARPPAGAAGPHALPGTEQRDVVSASGEVYRILIARPAGPPPAAGFPVTYVLDGNAVFGTLTDILRGAELRTALMGDVLGGIEPALVVAVGYPGDAPYDLERRAADYTPGPGADRFLAFLEAELQPMIARDFPVDRARQALLGHSYGGLFALHVLFTRPQAFSTYVASSPSLWWNGGAILHEEEGLAARLAGRPAAARVILSVGEHEQELSPRERAALPAAKAAEREQRLRRRAMVDRIAALAGRLAAVPGVAVRYRMHRGETHGTVVPVALARAMPLLWGD